MPAWPSDRRDDEVWAVVAFMVKLSESPEFDTGWYRELIAVETAGDDLTGRLCARCHGVDGCGRGAAIPRLAGQHEEYLAASLRAFATGERHSGIMQTIAAELGEGTIVESARWYGRMEGCAPVGDQAAAAARGREITLRGGERRIPSCDDCHGPGHAGRDEAMPRLAGQDMGYMVEQLKLLKEGRRGGTERVQLMDEVVWGMAPNGHDPTEVLFAAAA